MTVNDAIDIYLLDSEARHKEGTYLFYKQYLGYISRYLGNRELEALTKFDLSDMISKKRIDSPNVSNATLNKYITVSKILYRFITDEKINYRKLKEADPEIEVVDKDYMKRIFDHLKRNIHDKYAFRNYLYYRILLDTGLRLNEANHIMIKNIDFQKQLIYVNITKSGNSRVVPFTKETSQLMQDFIFLYCPDKQYLFFDFNTGDRLSTSAVETFTTRLKDKLKIPKSFSPHKWRHTFATSYVRNDGSLEVLRKILGQSKLEVTKRYLHLNNNDIINDYSRVHSITPNLVS